MKLTAKDLMVGDYMKYKDGTIVRIARVGDVSPMDAPIYCHTQLEGYFPCQLSDISPIPLTAEILEKNGFYFGYTSQQEDAASQIGCSCEKAWTYDEGGGSIQVTFPNECDGGLIVLDEQDFDKELEFVFANQIYVHELQHLIRICKINKEIVL